MRRSEAGGSRPYRGPGQPRYVNRGGMWVKVPGPAVKPRVVAPAPKKTVRPYNPAPTSSRSTPPPRITPVAPTGEHGGGAMGRPAQLSDAEVERRAQAYAQQQARARAQARLNATARGENAANYAAPRSVGRTMVRGALPPQRTSFTRGAEITGGPGRYQVNEFVRRGFTDPNFLQHPEKVAELQHMLVHAGYDIAKDGVFGPQTYAAYRDYTTHLGRSMVADAAARSRMTPTGEHASQLPPGLLVPGNINLANRPAVRNPDGSVSTVRSISVEIDGQEVLIPTVVNGRIVSRDAAIQHYRQTGQHLGIFADATSADIYAQALHQEEAGRVTAQDQVQQAAQPNGPVQAESVRAYQTPAEELVRRVPIGIYQPPPDRTQLTPGSRLSLIKNDPAALDAYKRMIDGVIGQLQDERPTETHSMAEWEQMARDRVQLSTRPTEVQRTAKELGYTVPQAAELEKLRYQNLGGLSGAISRGVIHQAVEFFPLHAARALAAGHAPSEGDLATDAFIAASFVAPAKFLAPVRAARAGIRAGAQAYRRGAMFDRIGDELYANAAERGDGVVDAISHPPNIVPGHFAAGIGAPGEAGANMFWGNAPVLVYQEGDRFVVSLRDLGPINSFAKPKDAVLFARKTARDMVQSGGPSVTGAARAAGRASAHYAQERAIAHRARQAQARVARLDAADARAMDTQIKQAAQAKPGERNFIPIRQKYADEASKPERNTLASVRAALRLHDHIAFLYMKDKAEQGEPVTFRQAWEKLYHDVGYENRSPTTIELDAEGLPIASQHLQALEGTMMSEGRRAELENLAGVPDNGNFAPHDFGPAVDRLIAEHADALPPGMGKAGLVTLLNELRDRAIKARDFKQWYALAAQAILRYTGDNVEEAKKIAALLAIYSPRAEVFRPTTEWNNLDRALNAYQQFQEEQLVGQTWVRPDGTTAKLEMTPWQTDAANAVMNGTAETLGGGLKVNAFYRNFLYHIDRPAWEKMMAENPSLALTTQDLHMRRAFRYPFKRMVEMGKEKLSTSGIKPAEYAFMDQATRAVADSLGWRPEEAQAAIWAHIKSEVEQTPLDQGGASYAHALAYKEAVSRGDQPRIAALRRSFPAEVGATVKRRRPLQWAVDQGLIAEEDMPLAEEILAALQPTQKQAEALVSADKALLHTVGAEQERPMLLFQSFPQPDPWRERTARMWYLAQRKVQSANERIAREGGGEFNQYEQAAANELASYRARYPGLPTDPAPTANDIRAHLTGFTDDMEMWGAEDEVARLRAGEQAASDAQAQEVRDRAAAEWERWTSQMHWYEPGYRVVTKGGNEMRIISLIDLNGEPGYIAREVGGATPGAMYEIPQSEIKHLPDAPPDQSFQEDVVYGGPPGDPRRTVPFYARAEKAISTLPDKFKAERMMNLLNKKAKLSKTDVLWARLEDFLAQRKPNEEITRQEVQDWYDQHFVPVMESEKTEAAGNTRHELVRPGGGTNYHELVLTFPQSRLPPWFNVMSYTAHWNEENFFGHLRSDDRLVTGAEGGPPVDTYTNWEMQGDAHTFATVPGDSPGMGLHGKPLGYQVEHEADIPGFTEAKDKLTQARQDYQNLKTELRAPYEHLPRSIDYTLRIGLDNRYDVEGAISELERVQMNRRHAQTGMGTAEMGVKGMEYTVEPTTFGDWELRMRNPATGDERPILTRYDQAEVERDKAKYEFLGQASDDEITFLRDKLKALHDATAKILDSEREIRVLRHQNQKRTAPFPMMKTWRPTLVRRAIHEAVKRGKTRFAWSPGRMEVDYYHLGDHYQKLVVEPVSRGVGSPYYNRALVNARDPHMRQWEHDAQQADPAPSWDDYNYDDPTSRDAYYAAKDAWENRYYTAKDAEFDRFTNAFEHSWVEPSTPPDQYTVRAWKFGSDTTGSPDFVGTVSQTARKQPTPEQAARGEPGDLTGEELDAAISKPFAKEVRAGKQMEFTGTDAWFDPVIFQGHSKASTSYALLQHYDKTYPKDVVQAFKELGFTVEPKTGHIHDRIEERITREVSPGGRVTFLMTGTDGLTRGYESYLRALKARAREWHDVPYPEIEMRPDPWAYSRNAPDKAYIRWEDVPPGFNLNGIGGTTAGPFDTELDAARWAETTFEQLSNPQNFPQWGSRMPHQHGYPVHYVDIPPEAAQKILNEGQEISYQMGGRRGPSIVKGALARTEHGNVLRLFRTSDMSTLIHEMAHVVQGMFDPAELERLGLSDPEVFARSWERYFLHGQEIRTGDTAMKEAFDHVAMQLAEIYRGHQGVPGAKFNPDIKLTFDRFFLRRSLQDARFARSAGVWWFNQTQEPGPSLGGFRAPINYEQRDTMLAQLTQTEHQAASPGDDWIDEALSDPSYVKRVADEIYPETRDMNVDERAQFVRDRLQGMRITRGRQEAGYHEARKARAEDIELAMMNKTGFDAYIEALQRAKGELPKLNYKGYETLTPGAMFQMMDDIRIHPVLKTYDKLRAMRAIEKATEGRVPTKSEIKLLETVFGSDVVENVRKIPSLGKRALRFLQEIWNIPRSISASFDFSAPLRQGLVMVARHPKAALFGFKGQTSPMAEMFRAFKSENSYQAILADIHSRRTYELMKQAKLAITDLGALEEREEQFFSNLAERIPLIGTQGVRRSSRAYTGFLIKLRADAFDALIKTAENEGKDVNNLKFLTDLGDYINAATGRGNLRFLEKGSTILNSIFFSPRLMASRINMLTRPINPHFLATVDPLIRKETLRAMRNFYAGVGTVLGLALGAGAELTGGRPRRKGLAFIGGPGRVSFDPRNADFGKLRLGNTRIDPMGGFQQYIRLAAQVGKGEIISSTTGDPLQLSNEIGGVSRDAVAWRFFRGKLAPSPSMFWDFFHGADFQEHPVSPTDPASWQRELSGKVQPLIGQDVHDLYTEAGGGEKGIAAGAAGYGIGTFGVGIQTYGPKPPSEKRKKTLEKEAEAAGLPPPSKEILAAADMLGRIGSIDNKKLTPQQKQKKYFDLYKEVTGHPHEPFDKPKSMGELQYQNGQIRHDILMAKGLDPAGYFRYQGEIRQWKKEQPVG